MTEWTSRPQMDLSRRSGKDVRTRTTKLQTQIHTVCTFNTLSLMPFIQHYHSHNNQHSDITDQRTSWDTISDSKQEDEGFTWLSWFFNQASSTFYGRHEQTQTHKVLRKCMNEATVYWVHVPRQETQINTVIARKRWRMEEEREPTLSPRSLFLTIDLWPWGGRMTSCYESLKQEERSHTEESKISFVAVYVYSVTINTTYLKYNQCNLGFLFLNTST